MASSSSLRRSSR